MTEYIVECCKSGLMKQVTNGAQQPLICCFPVALEDRGLVVVSCYKKAFVPLYKAFKKLAKSAKIDFNHFSTGHALSFKHQSEFYQIAKRSCRCTWSPIGLLGKVTLSGHLQ